MAWRQWAARDLVGLSNAQLFAAGDAAALTALLGARHPNEFITAARRATICSGEGRSSEASSALVLPAATPTGSAETVFNRLTAAGWQPVPLEGDQSLSESEQVFVRCSAEDWRYGSADAKEHYATEELGDALGEISGGFIGSIVGGVVGAAVRGAQKNADAEVKWRRVGTCEYVLTERRVLRRSGKEAKASPYETIRTILFHKDGGVMICFMDQSAITLKMPNWRLHKLVLEYMWKHYHELPASPERAASIQQTPDDGVRS